MGKLFHIMAGSGQALRASSAAARATLCGTRSSNTVREPRDAKGWAKKLGGYTIIDHPICSTCFRKWDAQRQEADRKREAKKRRLLSEYQPPDLYALEARRFVNGPVHCAAKFSKLWVEGTSPALCDHADPVNVAEYRVNVTCEKCLVLMDQHDEEALWSIPPRT